VVPPLAELYGAAASKIGRIFDGRKAGFSDKIGYIQTGHCRE